MLVASTGWCRYTALKAAGCPLTLFIAIQWRLKSVSSIHLDESPLSRAGMWCSLLRESLGHWCQQPPKLLPSQPWQPIADWHVLPQPEGQSLDLLCLLAPEEALSLSQSPDFPSSRLRSSSLHQVRHCWLLKLSCKIGWWARTARLYKRKTLNPQADSISCCQVVERPWSLQHMRLSKQVPFTDCCRGSGHLTQSAQHCIALQLSEHCPLHCPWLVDYMGRLTSEQTAYCCCLLRVGSSIVQHVSGCFKQRVCVCV